MVRCRVVKGFKYLENLKPGMIREFTEEEAERFEHYLTPLINSLDLKPDKKYKKGRVK